MRDQGPLAMIFSLVLALGLIALPARAQKIPSPSGDYCYDEVHEYLAAKFGLHPSQIKMKRLGANSWWHIHTWTPLCNSEFVFTGRATPSHECLGAQYGKRTYFVRSVHATGDCMRYLPQDEYLH